jgi:hypothetical protein
LAACGFQRNVPAFAIQGTQPRSDLRINCTMIPNENDFVEDDPLAAPMPRKGQRSRARGRQTGRRVGSAADTWEQAKEKAGLARERTEFFLRENPVPLILGALAAGLAIGLAIRYSASSEQKETETKSPLGHVDWSILSLPFLWPILKSLKEKYDDSAAAVRESVGQVRKIDIDRYTKPVRKRWKSWTH